jgi:hypothetical protein
MADSNSESASRDEHLVETSDINSPLLDGKFFRVVSVAYDGKIRASCTACTDGKKPLSGAIGSTSNFLNHLKVSFLKLIVWCHLLMITIVAVGLYVSSQYGCDMHL